MLWQYLKITKKCYDLVGRTVQNSNMNKSLQNLIYLTLTWTKILLQLDWIYLSFTSGKGKCGSSLLVLVTLIFSLPYIKGGNSFIGTRESNGSVGKGGLWWSLWLCYLFAVSVVIHGLVRYTMKGVNKGVFEYFS